MREELSAHEVLRRLDQLNRLGNWESQRQRELLGWFAQQRVPLSLDESSGFWRLDGGTYEQREQIATTIARFPFEYKPLVFGEAALLYYGLRAACDLDVLVPAQDFAKLARCSGGAIRVESRDRYIQLAGPRAGENREGGLLLLECWETTAGLSYEQLVSKAEESETYRVMALPRVLLLKALYVEEEKQRRDVSMLAARILLLKQIG